MNVCSTHCKYRTVMRFLIVTRYLPCIVSDNVVTKVHGKLDIEPVKSQRCLTSNHAAQKRGDIPRMMKLVLVKLWNIPEGRPIHRQV